MIFKELAKQHAEYKLYGNIGNWAANGDFLTSLLDSAVAMGYTTLDIRMHCYGGSVFEGNVMYNALQRAEQRNDITINIYIDGVAASMGCFILPALENVFIAENAFGMVHTPSGNTQGNAAAHKATAKLLGDMETNFARTLSERTGKSADEIKALWLDGNDHWLNADEMVEFGFAKAKVAATAKNIKELDKQAAAEIGVGGVYSQFQACFKASLNDDSNLNDKQMDKLLLIQAFGLTGVDANSSDTAVLAALREKFTALDAKVTALEASAKADKETAVKAFLAQQKEAGKIVVPEGQTIDTVMASLTQVGVDSGLNTLQLVFGVTANAAPAASTASTAPHSLASFIQTAGAGANGNQGTDAPKDFNALIALGDEAVAKFKAEHKDDYTRLYKAEFGHEPRI